MGALSRHHPNADANVTTLKSQNTSSRLGMYIHFSGKAVVITKGETIANHDFCQNSHYIHMVSQKKLGLVEIQL